MIRTSGAVLGRMCTAVTALLALNMSPVAARTVTIGAHESAVESRLGNGEHFADLGDVKLWYRVAGHGPYVVVSSVNWGAGSLYLQAADGIRPLEKQFTMIYVNSRGTPPSTRPPDSGQMSTSLMVDDIESLRRHWGLDTLELLGHSGGGTIVLGYAERYPARTRKLVLLDAALFDRFPSPRTNQILEGWRKDPRYANAIKISDESDFPRTDAGFTHYLGGILPLYFHDPGRFLAVFERTLTNEVDYWVFEHNSAANEVTVLPQSKELGRVTAKTLVVVGRADFVCPVETSQAIAGGITGSRLVVFERTGHFPWIEERKRFFELVSAFLGD